MIIPMLKYTFLIHHADYDSFLLKLRELGVVHIIQPKKAGLSKEVADTLENYTRNIRFLKTRRMEPQPAPADLTAEQLLTNLARLTAERERLLQQQSALNKELQNLEPWGEYSHELVAKLKANNVLMRFYTCSKSRFKSEWMNRFNLHVIKQDGSTLFFVIFHAPSEIPELEAEWLKPAEKALSQVKAEATAVEQALQQIEVDFDQWAATGLDLLTKARGELLDKISFKAVKSSAEKLMDDKLMVLRGWAPTNRTQALDSWLNESDTVFYTEQPDNEPTPILLKNNPFARLFEPIGKLYSLPSYSEIDLTPFFAPFYMMFFGFCTADLAYGLVLFLAGTLGKLKVKNPAMRPLLSLVQVLGLSTGVLGFLFGAVLGFDIKEIAALEPFVPVKSNDQIFWLAITVGILQILFGVIMNFFNKVRSGGFKDGISTIGTFIFLIGITLLAGPSVKPGFTVSAQVTQYATWGTYLGLFLIFFFNAPGKNVFLNVGKGVWELYNIVTGFFGDMLSYIRLFALGVSGGILGLVINSIGHEFLKIPAVGPVFFVLFLIGGHAVNLALACLGGVVHPMRLTFVEFYKNSGFAGGGKAYNPFAQKQR